MRDLYVRTEAGYVLTGQLPLSTSGTPGDTLELGANGAEWVPQVFNVRLFGAMGNGTVDDTAALQAAFDAAGPVFGHVVVPPGTYLITATLILPQGVTLEGASRDGCVILANQLTSAMLQGVFTVFSPVNRQLEGRIARLTFNNTNRGAAGGVGLDLRQWTRMTVDNCRVRSVETGVRIEGTAHYNEFFNVYIHNCDVGLTVKNGANSTKLFGGQIDSCIDAAVDVVGGPDSPINDFHAFGTSFSNNAVVLRMNGDATNNVDTVYLHGPRLENNIEVVVYVPAATDFRAVRNTGVLAPHIAPGSPLLTNDRGLITAWTRTGIDLASRTALQEGRTSSNWYRETVDAIAIPRFQLVIPADGIGTHVDVWVIGIDPAIPGDIYERKHQAFVYGAVPTIHAPSVVDTPAAVADARIGTIGTADSAIDVSGGTVDVTVTGVAGKTIRWWVVARWITGDAT